MHAVQQGIPEPVTRMRDMLGGTVFEDANGLWKWSASCRVAKAAIGKMLPYLVIKKQQSLLGLSFQARRTMGTVNGSTFSVDREQDERDYLQMKHLKTIGRTVATKAKAA